jgi:hypothetical protein
MPLHEVASMYERFVAGIIKRKLSGKEDIQTLGIDTYDTLVEVFAARVCKENGIEDLGDIKGSRGKGYFLTRRPIFEMLARVEQAGMGWSLLAHTTTKIVNVGDKEVRVTSLAVSDSFKGAAFRRCEHMLVLERGQRTIEVPPKEKVVEGRKITIPSKSRVEKCVFLRTEAGTLSGGDSTEEVKSRLPIPDRLVIPEKAAWDALSHAYEEAAAKVQE